MSCMKRELERRTLPLNLTAEERALKERVYEALNNAYDNGYTFDGWTLDSVAADMVTYDADLEQYADDPSKLVPYIDDWKKLNANVATDGHRPC